MTKHTHQEIKHTFKGGFSIAILETEDCIGCMLEEAEKLTEEKKREQRFIEMSDVLSCDKCGKDIGYAYEDDLNGSRFYCINCKKKPK